MKISGLSAVALASAVALMSACTSGGGGAGGGGTVGTRGGASRGGGATMTSTEACKAMFTTLCDRLYSCFTSDQLADFEKAGGFTDAAGCAKKLSDDSCPGYKTAVDKKTITFNAGLVSGCTAGLKSLACGNSIIEFLENGRKSSSCKGIFTGTVDKLGDCTISSECQGKDAQCAGGQKCTAALSGDSYEKECSTKTVESCDGLVCLTLKANKQNMTGICTARCDDNPWACGEGGKCAEMPDKSQLCVSTCTSNADCGGGFVCPSFFADGTKACLVDVD